MPPSQAIPNIGFENTEWNFTSQGKHLLAKDSPPLYNIYHPWEISKYRDFAAITAQLDNIGRIS